MAEPIVRLKLIYSTQEQVVEGVGETDGYSGHKSEAYRCISESQTGQSERPPVRGNGRVSQRFLF